MSKIFYQMILEAFMIMLSKKSALIRGMFSGAFGDKENDFKQLILDKMVDEIQTLTTLHNYNFKNITILCNSRKSISVAEYFSKNGILLLVTRDCYQIQKRLKP